MNEKKMVFLDSETTGLNPPKDKIVEIAIIDFSGQVLINTLVNPQMKIPESVIKIHHIHDGLVRNSPVFEEVLRRVKRIFRSVQEVIIYNADFDTRFFPPSIWEKVSVICCMKEFIYVYEELEGHFSSQRFPLSKAFNVSTGRKIEGLGETHRALPDCLASQAVWNWCMTKRKIIDDPQWNSLGHEAFCMNCRKNTFHKFRPRYREGFNKYFQCIECLQNNIAESEMKSIMEKSENG